MWTMELVLAAACGFAFLCLQNTGRKNLPLACEAGEADVRIATEKPRLDFAQQEAESYIAHRKNGNIEKARKLGEELGAIILQDMPLMEQALRDWILIDHGKMLYIFVAERVVRDLAPDTILSQVSVAAFRQVITREIEAVYEGLAGSRADTFYQLSYFRRPKEKVAYYMGQTFAQISGREEEKAVAKLGETMFLKMYEKCQAICSQVPYTCL